MMLRATVADTDPRDLTRVWVTIPQKYGTKPVRVFTRVEVSKGDHVYVANTSVTRVPQWVVFGQQTEIGRWSNPAPHTHPIGQVDGLVDWVKQYEAWTKDHQARLDAADKQIADGKLVVAQARKDLDQAQTDIADAVRKATVEQARLDQAEANLDQMGRNLLAAGGRISANETALGKAQDRLASAETTVQKTSTDLNTLQGTVGDVQAKAADALAKAGAAQVSADGKTTITRATSPASQPGKAVGDTHFTMSTMGGGGVVTRQQRWDGSTWQDESLSHQVLASLDLGKATVGELDGGYIKANSILSDRVVVSSGENLIPDPTFLSDAMNASRLAGTGWKIATAANGPRVLSTLSTTETSVPLTGAPGTWFQVDSTAKYQLQLLAAGPDQLSVYLVLLFVDGTSKADGYQMVRPLTGTLAPRIIEWDLAAMGGPVAVRPMVRRNPTPAGAKNYAQQVGSVSFRRKVGTVLIEDGAVTGDKVEASTVSGAIGQFLKVEAQSGTFTDSLTGRNARLLGETVAESINITGKLRGRDAILSGTVDIGQLNVTGEMSAKIISTATLQARQGFFTDGLTAQDAALLGTTVAENLVVTDAFSARVVNAMTAQTKQLVVTEDAILNKATVIKSLVTPELIASKVDTRYLRSDNITTGMLEVLGRFRTAPMGQSQIIIQPSQSAWNNKDLAIWWTPDGTTPGAGNASAPGVAGGIWMNPTSDSGAGWEGRTLNLRGQNRAGVTISDGLMIQATDKATGCSILSSSGQRLNVIGSDGLWLQGNGKGVVVKAQTALEMSCVDGNTVLLGKTTQVVANNDMKMISTNGDVMVESGNNNEVRLHAGPSGVKFTSKNGNSWSYDITTSTAANLNIDGSGKIFRVTSSRRYKKFISDAPINPGDIEKVRLRKWRDRKLTDQPEDPLYHHGAIAEELDEVFPQFVPRIPDPTALDAKGNQLPDAPLIPDSIEYAPAAFTFAVAGYQDLAPRVRALEDQHAKDAATIKDLNTRLTALEGHTA